MTHNIHVEKAPCYLSDALQLTSTRVTRSDLRSSENPIRLPLDSTGSPKAECMGILYLGGIAGVFLKAHGWGFQKVRCCIWVPCRSTPNFAPNMK